MTKPETNQAAANKFRKRIILPGSTIGILGGGQLGRMMVLDGRKMGYRFVTLDPVDDSPAGQVSDTQIVGDYSSIQAAEQLAHSSDVVTYEFENVNAQVTSFLSQRCYVPQGSRLLYITQHRLREKSAIESAGATVAPYAPVASKTQFTKALESLGLPCVLKTCFGGYDGKGQWIITDSETAEEAWIDVEGHFLSAKISSQGQITQDQDSLRAPLVLEKQIPFICELSVIVARNPWGEVRTFPVAENIHRQHILHMSIVPARIPDDIANAVKAIAANIATVLGLVGVLGVELFLLPDGTLYVNELAPRPHNSGHYTMDACATSQFEQHLRAVCGLPLGGTTLWTPVVMVNVLGKHIAGLMKAIPQFSDNIKIHLYGKAEVREKRKMGHINVLADNPEEALKQISQMDLWKN